MPCMWLVDIDGIVAALRTLVMQVQRAETPVWVRVI